MHTPERKRAHRNFAIVGLIVGLVLIGNLYLQLREKPNAGNGCLRDIPGKTVILLDHSEPVALQTRSEIIDRAWAFVESRVKPGELVSVFTITDAVKKELAPVFSHCKPDTATNELTTDERTQKSKFQIMFEKPMREVLERKIVGSNESPIAEALIDLSLSGKFLAGSSYANLVIFSDMLEHTKGLSMYKCSSREEAVLAFQKSRSGKMHRPSFMNTYVGLHVIPRSNINVGNVRCRDGFWAWFFGDNVGGGATVERFDLPG